MLFQVRDVQGLVEPLKYGNCTQRLLFPVRDVLGLGRTSSWAPNVIIILHCSLFTNTLDTRVSVQPLFYMYIPNHQSKSLQLCPAQLSYPECPVFLSYTPRVRSLHSRFPLTDLSSFIPIFTITSLSSHTHTHTHTYTPTHTHLSTIDFNSFISTLFHSK